MGGVMSNLVSGDPIFPEWPTCRALTVHARLTGIDRPFNRFGLHVYGTAVALSTSWDEPLIASNEDWFGPVFDIALVTGRAPKRDTSGRPALGLTLHRGDVKRSTLELRFDEIPAPGGQLWFGDFPKKHMGEEPSATDVPCGDFGSCGARAHWLTPGVIVWRAATGAPAGTRFRLHSSATGSLVDAGPAGIKGSDEWCELIVVSQDLTEDLAEKHPYLTGCAMLQVPESVDVRRICQNQIAISMQLASYSARLSVWGEGQDCTGVQIGALLDELFAYNGCLGCGPPSADTPLQGASAKLSAFGFGFWSAKEEANAVISLTLWAPTAKLVKLVMYESATSEELERRPMRREDEEGVWRAQGPMDWYGRYYTYLVEAYHPTERKFITTETPDPYSTVCSADGRRSLVCGMEMLLEAVPSGDVEAWKALPVPALPCREASVIYELHVRDFSAHDKTVPEKLKGKYLAFCEEGTNGDKHLRQLADAGVTHVQLLPTFEFGSVPEVAADRVEPKVPDAPEDSENQQAAITKVANTDSYNWGYDPVLYMVPEGSYATVPHGVRRVLEHRMMVDSLHAKGLRVVVDVVFNHTFESGCKGKSVLDKCVPGYYHRRSEGGENESSTCMNNTAAERKMMQRLIVDTVLFWAREHRVDGFRFDLMGHIPLRVVQRCRKELDALTLEKDGVDGKLVLLHGEGWEFGEVAESKRGTMAVQRDLAGTGIGSFNDRLRDAILGGSPFADPRVQGFATGLGLRPWPATEGVHQGNIGDLLIAADKIRVSLAGGLKDFVLAEDCHGNSNIRAGEIHGGGVAYTSSPGELVNYVSAHDNLTLYDQTVWKMSSNLFSAEERLRANWLCMAAVVLGHGIPFLHAGDELLRSKSLDRDSYNSGDWFNMLDFTGELSAFGTGLPPAEKNAERWDLMRPLLANANLRPTQEAAARTKAKLIELLRIRSSTSLIGLLSAGDIMKKVNFPGCGTSQTPGLVVMQTCNGPSGETDVPLDARFARVIVVLNARLTVESVRAPSLPSGGLLGGTFPLELHPEMAASKDPTLKGAEAHRSGSLTVPALSAVVFVEPMKGRSKSFLG